MPHIGMMGVQLSLPSEARKGWWNDGIWATNSYTGWLRWFSWLNHSQIIFPLHWVRSLITPIAVSLALYNFDCPIYCWRFTSQQVDHTIYHSTPSCTSTFAGLTQILLTRVGRERYIRRSSTGAKVFVISSSEASSQSWWLKITMLNLLHENYILKRPHQVSYSKQLL